MLHFIWIQGLDHLVSHDRSWPRIRDAWANHLPGFEQRVWARDELRAVVAEVAPACLPLFDDEQTPFAIMADVGRFAVLYKYGGVYSDVDMRPIRSMTHLFHDVDLFYFVNVLGLADISIIAAVPGMAPRQ